MTKAKAKSKKRNPSDATGRNVRASLSRDLKLDARLTALEQRVDVLEQRTASDLLAPPDEP